MSLNLSLDQLKGAFKNESQGGEGKFTSTYYPFYNMKPGQRVVVRFLPDLNESNPYGFLVEKVTHNLTINGQRRTVPCLGMYDEDCPVCKVSRDFYAVKDDVNGKKYWKKRSYIGQVLVVEDPLPANADTGETYQGKCMPIILGIQIYNIIKDAFGSDELEAVPYDFANGYDFIIKKTEMGQYSSYVTGTKFANRQRPLTDEELAEAEAHMVDLSTLLPNNPGEEFVRTRLNADMNGSDIEESGSTQAAHTHAPATASAATSASWDDGAASTPSAAPAQAPAATSSAGTNSVDDMLAAIRSRRAASKQ